MLAILALGTGATALAASFAYIYTGIQIFGWITLATTLAAMVFARCA